MYVRSGENQLLIGERVVRKNDLEIISTRGARRVTLKVDS